MSLQEANLRSVKVDSDDPLHLSSNSNQSLPSFVAAAVTVGADALPQSEGQDGMHAQSDEDLNICTPELRIGEIA